MGLFRTPVRADAYNKPRTLTASAARIRVSDRRETDRVRERSSGLGWQNDAWVYYDSIGEIKFAYGLVSNLLSRVRIYAAAVIDPEAPPVGAQDAAGIERPEGEDPGATPEGLADPISPQLAADAIRYTSALNGPAILRIGGLNLSVSGECYLAFVDGRWQALSTREIRVNVAGQMTRRKSRATSRDEVLPKDTPIGRIWRQHPEYSDDPDSSLLALRSECEELLLLGREIRGTTRSRLNAGLLYVPDELTVSARNPEDEAVSSEDVFEQELMSAMTEPISDETSGSGVVPMLVRGPSELGDKIKYMELSRGSDAGLIARSERLLERILQGLDVPKDVVTGLANVKYSNAVKIDENLYRAHIDPIALILVDALTEIYLRPMLRAAGHPDDQVERMVVWYDSSDLVSEPDQSADSNEGYDRYLLSGDAWRRARGFSDTDAPGEDELATRLVIDKVQIDPQVGAALLEHTLPEVLGAAKAAAREESQFPDDLSSLLGEPAPAEAPAEPISVETGLPAGQAAG